MKSQIIEEILNGRGTTRSLICSPKALSLTGQSFQKYWNSKKWFLIADKNTYNVCGSQVIKEMKKAGLICAGQYIFPGTPALKADYQYVSQLTDKIREAAAVPLVLGSGTLNDLVKRAAFEAETEYAVVATAASVDGYASDGAALLHKGVKQTFPCAAPRLIIADTEILMSAPADMTAAGYGDLAGKIPAGADWIIADQMNQDPIEPEGWGLIHNKLDQWLSCPEGTVKGEADPLSALFEGLSYAGVAMQLMKRSRPVSGAEHLISHIWEMQGLKYKGKHVSHGFKVAVGTCLSLKLYDFLISEMSSPEGADTDNWYPENAEERTNFLKSFFTFLDDCSDLEKINQEKWLPEEQQKERRNLILTQWSELVKRLGEYLPTTDKVTEDLKLAGCPTSPEEIGVSAYHVFPTLAMAHKIRNRYTILDMLHELGYFRIPVMKQRLKSFLTQK